MADTRTPDARTVEELVEEVRRGINDQYYTFNATRALDTLTSRLEALEAERNTLLRVAQTAIETCRANEGHTACSQCVAPLLCTFRPELVATIAERVMKP